MIKLKISTYSKVSILDPKKLYRVQPVDVAQCIIDYDTKPRTTSLVELTFDDDSTDDEASYKVIKKFATAILNKVSEDGKINEGMEIILEKPSNIVYTSTSNKGKKCVNIVKPSDFEIDVDNFTVEIAEQVAKLLIA